MRQRRDADQSSERPRDRAAPERGIRDPRSAAPSSAQAPRRRPQACRAGRRIPSCQPGRHQVEYDPIGSGGGRETFLSGGSDFAGSDAALKDDEFEQSKDRCAGDQGAINLPHYISPIAIPYNLPSIEGSTST